MHLKQMMTIKIFILMVFSIAIEAATSATSVSRIRSHGAAIRARILDRFRQEVAGVAAVMVVDDRQSDCSRVNILYEAFCNRHDQHLADEVIKYA